MGIDKRSQGLENDVEIVEVKEEERRRKQNILRVRSGGSSLNCEVSCCINFARWMLDLQICLVDECGVKQGASNFSRNQVPVYSIGDTVCS